MSPRRPQPLFEEASWAIANSVGMVVGPNGLLPSGGSKGHHRSRKHNKGDGGTGSYPFYSHITATGAAPLGWKHL